MASTATNRESALRASVLDHLHYTTQGMESALDIAGAIASAVAVVHAAVADFAQQSNRTRSSVLWNRIPEELKLETARWLPRAELMGVSRDMRTMVVSDHPRWTKIALPNRDMNYLDRTKFLRTMVPRSGSCVVDLDWPSECVASPIRPDAARDIVLGVLPRVRTLVLHPRYFQSGVRTFWKTPTPHLQSLTITDGTPGSSIALKPFWTAKDMPRLRHLKLDAASFRAQPLATPFAGVVHLEATIGADSDRDVWDHIWDWFPHLERLIAHLDIFHAFVILPPPPASLRHVTLVGAVAHPFFLSPVMRQWVAHRVRTLELFTSDPNALFTAERFLQTCDPGPWAVSFVPSCCPARGAYSSTILRGARATVVVRSCEARDHCAQIRLAAGTVVFSSIDRLTLIGPAMEALFNLCPTLPALRELTIVGTAWMDRLAQPPRPDLLRAPALEQLVVDVTREADPFGRVSLVWIFVDCIGNPSGLHTTILVHGALKGRYQVTSSPDVHVGYAPLEQQHDCPCNLARAKED